MKIIVFDLDETLGYFTQFGIIWNSLNKYIENYHNYYKLKYDDFCNILDLYPEFLRPEIIEILNYVKLQKYKGVCSKVIIYTNNKGTDDWKQFIKNYFEYKVNGPLFDQIISPITPYTQTHSKTINNLVKYVNILKNDQICFVDNTYFRGMNLKNVCYIKIHPYIFKLSFNSSVMRLINSAYINYTIFNNLNHTHFKYAMILFFKQYLQYVEYDNNTNNNDNLKIHNIVSKKLMENICLFFYNKHINNNKSNKLKKYNKTNKTKKQKSKYY